MQRLIHHMLGTYHQNHINALKEILGVEKLDLVLLDSMEELYEYAPFLREDPETLPAKRTEPEAPPV